MKFYYSLYVRNPSVRDRVGGEQMDKPSETVGVVDSGCADGAIEEICVTHHLRFGAAHRFHAWDTGGWWTSYDIEGGEVTIVVAAEGAS